MFSLFTTLTLRKRPTWRKTFHSMNKAGFKDFHIFSEPTAPIVQWRDTVQHWNKTNLGCYGNFYHGLKTMYETTDTPYILYFQDDLLCKGNTRSMLEQYLTHLDGHRLGYIDCYLPMKHKDLVTGGANIYSIPFSDHCKWGHLMRCYPREFVADFLKHPHAQKQYEKNSDCIIDQVCNRLNYEKWVVFPSLVRHTGHTSCVGHMSIPAHKSYGWEVK